MAGAVDALGRSLTSRGITYPSYEALTADQPGGSSPTEGGGAGSSYSYSGWTGPNSPRSNTVLTPNLLPQEHQFALEQQNNAARIAAEQARQKAQLAAEAESRRLKAITGAVGGVNQPGAVVGGSGPAGNEEAARAAAFGRAKEQAGQTAAASLKALEDVMAGRGLRGSTIEGNATADVLAGGQHELNDLVRSQLVSDTNRAGQISDRNYQGALTQRGQNLDYVQSLLGLLSSGGGIY